MFPSSSLTGMAIAKRYLGGSAALRKKSDTYGLHSAETPRYQSFSEKSRPMTGASSGYTAIPIPSGSVMITFSIDSELPMKFLRWPIRAFGSLDLRAFMRSGLSAKVFALEISVFIFSSRW